MPEENDQQNIAQVQEFIKNQVKQYFDEQVATQRSPQQVQSQEDAAQKQVRELINPYIEPGLNEARLTSQDAKDYVSFYMNNPDAKEYHDKVEDTFTKLVKAGRPIGRSDILKHMIGEEYQADPAKFMEKQSERHKAQVERAQGAVDFGSAALNKAKSDSVFANFEKLAQGTDLSESLKEMEKALDGVTF